MDKQQPPLRCVAHLDFIWIHISGIITPSSHCAPRDRWPDAVNLVQNENVCEPVQHAGLYKQHVRPLHANNSPLQTE